MEADFADELFVVEVAPFVVFGCEFQEEGSLGIIRAEHGGLVDAGAQLMSIWRGVRWVRSYSCVFLETSG